MREVAMTVLVQPSKSWKSSLESLASRVEEVRIAHLVPHPPTFLQCGSVYSLGLHYSYNLENIPPSSFIITHVRGRALRCAILAIERGELLSAIDLSCDESAHCTKLLVNLKVGEFESADLPPDLSKDLGAIDGVVGPGVCEACKDAVAWAVLVVVCWDVIGRVEISGCVVRTIDKIGPHVEAADSTGSADVAGVGIKKVNSVVEVVVGKVVVVAEHYVGGSYHL